MASFLENISDLSALGWRECTGIISASVFPFSIVNVTFEHIFVTFSTLNSCNIFRNDNIINILLLF